MNVPLSLTHNAYQWHIRTDNDIHQSKDRVFFDWFRTYSDQLQNDPRPIYRVVLPNTGMYAKLDWTHSFSKQSAERSGCHSGARGRYRIPEHPTTKTFPT